LSKTSEPVKNKAHAAVSKDFDDDDTSVFMACTGECPLDDGWYLDGGTTDHMTDRLEWFTSINEIQQGRWPVMIANNHKLWVRGVGQIMAKCLVDGQWENRTFKHVLYVPELRKNLFSVGQAANKGLVTTYTRHSCYLTSCEGRGNIILAGTCKNKLYRLSMEIEKPSGHAHIAIATSPVSVSNGSVVVA
jgi:hypothetical protein